MKIIVLGCGLVGGVIAKDLAADGNLEVTVADRSREAIDRVLRQAPVRGEIVDFSKPGAVRDAVSDFDMAVGAVPGFLGYNMLKEVIEAGKNIVDISFAPEDSMQLDSLAKQKEVTVLVDCGVAPGMSNILAGYAASLMDEAESCEILVGGLPVERYWPYEYRIVFSPLDTIDEYIRPARVMENGRIVEKEALSEVELVDFPGIGTLEAFNTDGLRTLLKTMKIPNMKEKTLRYPGHAEKMRMLRETGFFGSEPVEVGGVKVRPIDLTARLLFPMWKLKEGEKEFTVMRVTVKGKKDGREIKYTYNLVDYFDERTNTTSMARTTGFTCSIMARLVAKGQFTHKGVCPPEFVGQNHEVFKILLEELRKRGVIYKETIS
ncbi:saccharopine dehydrogenase family protein [Thermoanaerobacterium sp. DL9XJH110]|uniref:saccharopine dehydrogenase family protein n=1 Tax=Thermoanaerobacterium sp. DL9XJH110 TaxID=3386643 RepID=UPI003BB5C669